MRAGLLITVLLLFFSCSSNKKQLFKNSLDNYIDEHPINLLYEIDSLGNKKQLNCVYPSYQAYFIKDSTKSDRLILLQKMYYTDRKQTKYKKLKLRGFFIYKEKYPIIIFDEQNLSDRYVFHSLKTKIVDSLKYEFDKCNGQLIHNKNNRSKAYSLSTGE